MKARIFLIVGFSILGILNLHAQNTIILQPNAEDGKDSYLRSLSPSNNYGTHPDFMAHVWTNSGDILTVRGLIDFDLSAIPIGAEISTATLSLFSTVSGNGSHSTLSGSNEASLSRVITPWSENSVTWDSQPSTTIQNQVILAESDSTIQDYIVDVTNLIQDMVEDPENSHGFLLRLVTEEHYRRMLFASSDHTDSALHPRLEISYSMPSSLTDQTDNLNAVRLFPNPASTSIKLELQTNSFEAFSVDFINARGQLVKQLLNAQSMEAIDISEFSRGLYYIRVNAADFTYTQKLLVE